VTVFDLVKTHYPEYLFKLKKILDYLKRIEEEPEKVGKELEERVSSCIDFPGCVKSLYAYLLFSGLIPDSLMRFEREGKVSGVIFDPSNPELERLLIRRRL